jgi:hypothetical protein
MIKHRNGTLLLACVLSMSACGSDGVMEAPAPGTIQVTTTTTGADFDLDGYLARVGAEDPLAVEANQTLPFNNLDAGAYTVSLTDLASNCDADVSSQNVTVSAGGVTEVPFLVTCTALPPAAVDVTGVWEGTYDDGTGDLYFELAQSGDDVTGTAQFTWEGATGTQTSPEYPATGRVSGNELELFYIGWYDTLTKYYVRVTYHGVVSGSDMTGDTSEQLGLYSGTWEVTRQ